MIGWSLRSGVGGYGFDAKYDFRETAASTTTGAELDHGQSAPAALQEYRNPAHGELRGLRAGGGIAGIDGACSRACAVRDIGADQHVCGDHGSSGRVSVLARADQAWRRCDRRSEEHTSEPQSLMRISYA